MRFLTAVLLLLGFAVPTHAADKGLDVSHAPRETSNSVLQNGSGSLRANLTQGRLNDALDHIRNSVHYVAARHGYVVHARRICPHLARVGIGSTGNSAG